MKLRLLFLLVLTACPGGQDGPDAGVDAGSCFTGDPSLPPQLQVIHRTVSGTIAVTLANSPVPLIEPPQGGRVIFFGARALHMDGCPIEVTSTLRDQCTGFVLGFEQRDVIMRPNDAGWLEPEFPMELANYSNLAACPKANAIRNVYGEPYQLEVRLEDQSGRRVEATLENVVPVCAELEDLAECHCLCRGRYVLGECPPVPEDAGTIPGTCE